MSTMKVILSSRHQGGHRRAGLHIPGTGNIEAEIDAKQHAALKADPNVVMMPKVDRPPSSSSGHDPDAALEEMEAELHKVAGERDALKAQVAELQGKLAAAQAEPVKAKGGK